MNGVDDVPDLGKAEGIFAYFDRRRGTCNRLRGLSALSVIGLALGKPVYVTWAYNDPDQKLSDLLYCQDLIEVPVGGVPLGPMWVANTKTDPGRNALDFYRFIDNRMSQELFSFRCVAARQRWRPSDQVQNRIDRVHARHGRNLSEVLGVHIRRTDFNWKGHAPLDEDLLRLVLDELADSGAARVFLATDNLKDREMFKAEFGDKLFTSEADYEPGAFRQTSMVDALADVYLLSRCKYVYGTRGSSFSEYASTLGNVLLRHIGSSVDQDPGTSQNKIVSRSPVPASNDDPDMRPLPEVTPEKQAERLVWIMGKLCRSAPRTIDITNKTIGDGGFDPADIAAHMSREHRILFDRFKEHILGLTKIGHEHFDGRTVRPVQFPGS